MNKETEQQIKFEEADIFKRNVVYPLLAGEIREIHTSYGLNTLHLGIGSGLEICQIPEGLVSRAILVDKNREVLEVAEKKFMDKNYTKK